MGSALPCLAAWMRAKDMKRVVEAIAGAKPATPFPKFGDRVRIEMLDAEGSSLFGAIDQQLAKYTPSK